MSELIKVLLVEDDEDDYVLTRGLFNEIRGRRFEITWRQTYEAGRQAILQNQHDICLLDYRLGAKNGIDLLREAVAAGGLAPIILLTGLGERAVDVEAMKAGAADYLVKSGLRADSLERSIRYALERKRAAASAAFEQASLAAFGAEIGLALTQRETLNAILHQCANSMVRYLSVHLAQIWVTDSSDESLRLEATAGAINDVTSEANPLTRLFPGPEIIGNGKPVLVNHAAGDARVPGQEWVLAENITAYAGYPLMLENRLIGLITIFSRLALSPAVIQQMGSVANGIALSIERKRSAEALDASEVKYRTVVESLKEVVFQVNEFGHWTALNPAWTEITGIEVQEILGKLFLDFIHQDDRQRNSNLFLQLMQRKIDYCRYETRLITRDGKTCWVEMYAQLTVNNDGSILGASGSLTNITERKQAERQIQKLAAFPQQSPNPVLELDANGTLTYFNDAAQALAKTLGCEHPDAILPKGAADLVRKSLATATKKLNEEVSLGGRTISWSFFPIMGSQVVHVYGVDITEMQSLEAQFRHSQKLESVGQLAAGVAHDFNNILTVVQGYSDHLLARYDGDAALTGPLTQICHAAHRAGALTRQLLMFSRKQVLQPKIIDLNAVVQNLSHMLARLLGEDIALQFDYATTLPALEADTGMLEQVIMNLSVNARDAMPKGGQLRITTSAVEIDAARAQQHPDARAGQTVCLSVRDTGSGMDRATLERIFEPFFSTKEVGKGTGLGLATVYGIVKQHQGWIDVKSDVGMGTNFQIYLPASNKTRSAATEFIRKNAVTAKGSRETILLVEDEAIVRQWVKEILLGCDYRVVEAAHGVEALKVWDEQEGKIDLLITDMVMPEGLTGGELAQRLKSKQPLLKIIYTSGYSSEIMSNAAGLPDGPFLAKPYASPQLARMVRDCLDAGMTASS